MEFPSSESWNLKYDGYGAFYQILDTSQSLSSPNSLKLEAQYNWASAADHSLSEKLERITYEVDVKIGEPLSIEDDGRANAQISIVDPDVGWGKSYGSVIFGVNGFVGDSPYNYDQWYHVKINLDMKNRTFDAWVDDKQIATNSPVPADGFYKAVRLCAENAGHTRVWFDNVKVIQENIDVDFEEVKFRGKFLEDRTLISYYSFDVQIDEILEDPGGNLKIGEIIFVTGNRNGSARVDAVTVGDEVEVFGEYRADRVFLSDIDETSSEHYVIKIEEYEEVSKIIIWHEVEPDVIKLTFSSPYLDNVEYSLDEGFEELLEEPYEINISGLEDGSNHSVAVYANDVFGNENSTTFQFTRNSSSNEVDEDSSNENTDDNDSSNSSSGSSGGSSSSSSSGSSGGGGTGGSPEPSSNVEVKELSQQFITNGNHVKFLFPKNATCITYVAFDPKKTAGKTTTIIEMLKGKSILVTEPPSGKGYENVNIWVGNEGTASPENIENAIVGFRVEKSWLNSSGVDAASVRLWRFDSGKWRELSTIQTGEGDNYVYFEADTPGFSPFSITALSEEAVMSENAGESSAVRAAEGADTIAEMSGETSGVKDNISDSSEASTAEEAGPGLLESMKKVLLVAALLSATGLLGFLVLRKQS